MIKIKDVMTPDIITIEANSSIYEAAVQMKKYDIGFIPVVEGDDLVGVVTDRDIIIKGIAEKISESESVKKVMTDECIAVDAETSVDEAAEIMAEHQVRRLCVVEDGEMIGICAMADLAVRSKLIKEAGEALHEISTPKKQSAEE